MLNVVEHNYRPRIASDLLVGLSVREIAEALPDSGFLAAWERAQRVLFTGRKTYVSVCHPFDNVMFCGVAELKNGYVVVRLFVDGGEKCFSAEQENVTPAATR